MVFTVWSEMSGGPYKVTATRFQKLATSATVGSIAMSLLIILSSEDLKVLTTDSAIFLSSAAALGVAAMLAYRRRLLHEKGDDASIAILLSIALWCAAEATWLYTNSVLKTEAQVPSVADVFWLAGYMPFAYSIIKEFERMRAASRSKEEAHGPSHLLLTMTAIIVTIGLLSFPVFTDAIQENQENIPVVIVVASYPLLDGILLVYAIGVIIQLRTMRKIHDRWMLFSISLILFAISDSGYGYQSIVAIEYLSEPLLWDTFYIAAYLWLAFGLLWDYRFTGNLVKIKNW